MTADANSMRDDELVTRSLEAQDAFGVLVDRYYRMVYSVAYARVGQRETAEEVAQEAFLRAYLHLKTLKQAGRFSAWVGCIARNVAENWRTCGRTRSELLRTVPLDGVEDETPDTRNVSPRERLQADQECAALQDALSRLPVEQREVILLHFLDGLSKSEIARRLDLVPSSVGRRLDRALESLRRLLGVSAPHAVQHVGPSGAAVRRTALAILTVAGLPYSAKAELLSASADGIGLAAATLPSPVATGPLLQKLTTFVSSGGKLLLTTKGVAVAGSVAVAVALITMLSWQSLSSSHPGLRATAELQTSDHARTRIRALQDPSSAQTHNRDASLRRDPRARVGASDALTSGTAITSESATRLADSDVETSEARTRRWKELGLQIVPVRIVDKANQPLPGVRIEVDAVCLGQRGQTSGHISWNPVRHGRPPVDVTGPDGRAILASPVMYNDLMMATGISFTASKQTYAKRRIFAYPVDGSKRDEVLARANTLIIAAYIGDPSQRVADFTPNMKASEVGENDWIALPDARKMADIVPDGKHALSVERRTPDGNVWHSDAKLIEFSGGQTDEVEIELKPALELRGQLSDNVPRPVKGGKVVACSQWRPPGPRVAGDPEIAISRESKADVNEDGTFVLTALPEGPGEIIGICDGFIASRVSRDTQQTGGENQAYDLRPGHETAPFVLQMTPAGTLKVHVMDASGRPIPGAQVVMSPNVYWSVGGSAFYVSQDLWHADTGANGIAEIRNLRPGNESYAVFAKGWGVPAHVESNELGEVVSRNLKATIVASQTVETSVTLEQVPDYAPGR